jgi:Asp-tRNA(Asn)/Glu-tRNA(Gln) amidotransferase A subunit family amidase
MFSASEILSKIRLGQLTALEVTYASLNSINSTDNELMAYWELYS